VSFRVTNLDYRQSAIILNWHYRSWNQFVPENLILAVIQAQNIAVPFKYRIVTGFAQMTAARGFAFSSGRLTSNTTLEVSLTT